MERVLLMVAAASGLFAASSRDDRRYHFVYERLNMTEARSHCREKHTDLATVDNMEDVSVLTNMVNLSRLVEDENKTWIGLYDDRNKWRWSLSDAGFYDPSEAGFRQWGPDEPNNKGSNELCTEINDNGLWNDLSCDHRLVGVCMDVTGQKATFVLTTTTMTWLEAQSHCRAHHTDLASVRNMEENQKIKELVPGGGVTWIGLFRDAWKWTDGSNSSFRFWAPTEPNNRWKMEDCVVADFGNSGLWEDWNCDWKRPFVCYSAPTSKRVMKLRLLKRSSSLDLNDPAVSGRFLEQLRQRLKDQGLQGDFRLSWRKQPDGKVFHQEQKKAGMEREDL